MAPISEADLFYADLTGLSPRALHRVRARARRRANSFYADLADESVDLLIPDDFGEQGRRTPSVATTVDPCPAIWIGIDKSELPSRSAERPPRPVNGPEWMGTLIDNSNVRFTGAYVTRDRLPGHAAADFTASSMAVARNWIPNIQTLSDQGWGVVFFYVGYSRGGREPAPAGGANRARGILHGRHLRTTLHELGPQWAGATVFVDNEDSVDTSLTPELIEYYGGIFDEMSRPDANLAAFRPALYGHGGPIGELLQRRRDLFIWDAWYDTATTTTADAPYESAVDPLTVDPVTRPIRAYEATPIGGRQFIAWPLGRQFRSYTGTMPSGGSAVARRVPGWQQVRGWDYNTSFVRNPAFPVAEPRIAAQQYVSTAIVVAGVFQARTQGANPTPPHSRIISPTTSRAVAITTAGGVTVEPDAPLTLFFRGGELLLATVLSGGEIGVAVYDGLLGTWGPIQRAAGAVPALRRARALQGISNTASQTHVFFIGLDHRLYVKRQTRTRTGWTDWSDGQAVADDRLHPFSMLAGVARRGDWIETFFIDEQGLLASAWWSRRFTSSFPGFRVQRLEAAPSLLAAGALAAVTPHPDHLLVFGVGRDGRLRFAVFVTGQGWTPLTALGTAQDLVGVHTRLAVHAVNGSEVELAALTDSGSLAIYPFRLTGATWTADARRVVADPPAAGSGRPASGFRINPFGDLALVRRATAPASSVICAGTRGADARALRWDGGAQEWQPLAN